MVTNIYRSQIGHTKTSSEKQVKVRNKNKNRKKQCCAEY